MHEHNFTTLLTLLLIMLFLGRALGAIAKKFGFPEITGELLAGVLLGPTFLGSLDRHIYEILFVESKDILNFMQYFVQLSLILIMFATGLEVDFLAVLKQKKAALLITAFSVVIPFSVGLIIALYIPDFFLTPETLHSKYIFPLFLGTAFAIEALPVIAKILVDTGIIHTAAGAIILSTAVLTDIIGWAVFAIITKAEPSPNVWSVIFVFIFFIITHRLATRFIRAYLDSIAHNSREAVAIITLSLCLCLLFSAMSNALSLHFCLGAFLAGIIVRELLVKHTAIKQSISNFVMSFFGTIYFVSIGTKVNFIEHFNLSLVITILILASLSKIISAFIGAYFSGIKGKTAMAISITLNARGAMEIVFSSIALSLGIISDPVYIALVIMALLTSMFSGVLVKRFATQTVISV